MPEPLQLRTAAPPETIVVIRLGERTLEDASSSTSAHARTVDGAYTASRSSRCPTATIDCSLGWCRSSPCARVSSKPRRRSRRARASRSSRLPIIRTGPSCSPSRRRRSSAESVRSSTGRSRTPPGRAGRARRMVSVESHSFDLSVRSERRGPRPRCRVLDLAGTPRSRPGLRSSTRRRSDGRRRRGATAARPSHAPRRATACGSRSGFPASPTRSPDRMRAPRELGTVEFRATPVPHRSNFSRQEAASSRHEPTLRNSC